MSTLFLRNSETVDAMTFDKRAVGGNIGLMPLFEG